MGGKKKTKTPSMHRRLGSATLPEGKATRISHGRNHDETMQLLKKKHCAFKMVDSVF